MSATSSSAYSADCRQCRAWLSSSIRSSSCTSGLLLPWCRRSAMLVHRLVIVGLAPARMVPIASSAVYRAIMPAFCCIRLCKFGFSSRPESIASDDGLVLHDCRITNAVKMPAATEQT